MDQPLWFYLILTAAAAVIFAIAKAVGAYREGKRNGQVFEAAIEGVLYAVGICLLFLFIRFLHNTINW